MKYTIKHFRKDFPNDDRCLEYIFKMRFPGVNGFHQIKGKKRYDHQGGSKHIAPLVGTIFQKSSTPLSLWFYAIYLFSVSKNGVSAKELQRQLGVTYKTAWRMASQIRKLMAQDNDKLSGIVEIDEAYIERKPVMGAIERGGKVKVRAVESKSGAEIARHAIKNVSSDAHLMSDNSPSYIWLDKMYKRESVQHSNKEWVRGNVNTNSMEAFWAQVKRSIKGTHHFVSPKHLQSYLDFFAFQHDYRTSEGAPFLALLAKACR